MSPQPNKIQRAVPLTNGGRPSPPPPDHNKPLTTTPAPPPKKPELNGAVRPAPTEDNEQSGGKGSITVYFSKAGTLTRLNKAVRGSPRASASSVIQQLVTAFLDTVDQQTDVGARSVTLNGVRIHY